MIFIEEKVYYLEKKNLYKHTNGYFISCSTFDRLSDQLGKKREVRSVWGGVRTTEGRSLRGKPALVGAFVTIGLKSQVSVSPSYQTLEIRKFQFL